MKFSAFYGTRSALSIVFQRSASVQAVKIVAQLMLGKVMASTFPLNVSVIFGEACTNYYAT
jgi:hypothetical protein